MTAWDKLVNAGGLSGATAWEQLGAIRSGGVVIYTEIEASIVPEITADIENQDEIAEIDGEEIAATLEQDLGSELE